MEEGQVFPIVGVDPVFLQAERRPQIRLGRHSPFLPAPSPSFELRPITARERPEFSCHGEHRRDGNEMVDQARPAPGRSEIWSQSLSQSQTRLVAGCRFS